MNELNDFLWNIYLGKIQEELILEKNKVRSIPYLKSSLSIKLLIKKTICNKQFITNPKKETLEILLKGVNDINLEKILKKFPQETRVLIWNEYKKAMQHH